MRIMLEKRRSDVGNERKLGKKSWSRNVRKRGRRRLSEKSENAVRKKRRRLVRRSARNEKSGGDKNVRRRTRSAAGRIESVLKRNEKREESVDDERTKNGPAERTGNGSGNASANGNGTRSETETMIVNVSAIEVDGGIDIIPVAGALTVEGTVTNTG
jgi:hypothetical protein